MAVVSVSMGVMKPVLAKLATLMGDEYKKIKGLRKAVAFLQRELGDMDALLEKMDSADELDPQAKKWRRDIIEMSYNIEDGIDDFMHTVGEADGKIGILQKFAKYLRTFKDRRRLANDFQEIKTLFIEASDRRNRYRLDQCISVTNPVVVDPRMSALYKESASLVGIEAQKDEVVSWAMDEGKHLKLMAIVGCGGLGKTTLANEVYREIQDKYEHAAFVSVSQKPQMKEILNSLLSQLGLRTYSHACQLQDPINDLAKHLQDKRYFIVVDDLWDSQAWDAIQCAFPRSNNCSRVIITTRNENVARSCCHNHGFIHNMKHLSEQDSRKLFFDRIFGSEDACPTELKKASCEILKKCGGLPLAIITMASMLACQTTRLEEQWDYIQSSLATKSTTSSNYEEMMYILDLSYKNLPRHLKACFLYIGSYPEDHEIRRVDLVRQWVAEGFVSSSTKKDVWDVAESYFNELVNRSLIQPTYLEFDIIEASGCRVHDMLLDLILRRCKEDNFLHLANIPKATEQVKDQGIHRLTVVGLGGNVENDTKLTVSTSWNLSHIRSLTILGNSKWIPPLLNLKVLRVLSLQDYYYKIVVDLTCINQLPQLRYLNVKGKVKLPCQIRGLRLLETLDLCDSSPVTAINNSTLEIVDVPCLTNLLLPYHDIRLPNDDTTSKVKLTCTLESIIGMGQLNTLLELGFNLPKRCAPLAKATWMAALRTSLEKLSNLRSISLYYDEVACCVDELSSLSPSFDKLKTLRMYACTFSRFPRWIGHLQNLRELWLGVKQMVQEDFGIIGTGAPSLLILNIRIAGILTERVMISGSMGFTSVKYFEFDCDCISYLSFEARAMPKLEELELAFDAKEWDKAAPGGLQHLPSLKKIKAQRSCYDTAELWGHQHASNYEDIKGVFQKAADALRTCPTFIFKDTWRRRPIEIEECLNVVDQ